MRTSPLALVLALVFATPAYAGWSPFGPGVDYFNDTLPGPRKVFGLRVDLCHPGVRLRATTSGERGKRTSSWGPTVGVLAAINGGYFKTGYAPDAGTAKGAGALWHDATESAVRGWIGFGRHGLEHSPAEEVRAPADWIEEAVNGDATLVAGGVAVNCGGCGGGRAPRTAIGVTADHRTVYLMVVDGRSTSSIGMTIDELAVFMAGFGVDRAMNLDGGGSSTLWLSGTGVVNRPSDGSERTVGNHLGVFAAGVGPAHHCPTGYGAEYTGGGFPEGAKVTLEPGEIGTGYLDFRNIGTATWSPALTRLAPTPGDQPSPFAAPDWIAPTRITAPLATTPPGEIGRFAFSVTAPMTVGSHRLYLDLVEEFVAWFSNSWGPPAQTFYLTVDVVARPALRARLEAVTLEATELEPNAATTARVLVTNTGESTWAPGLVRLGTTNPRDAASALVDPSWLSVNRVVANPTEVARGQQATFEFLVRAPRTPGTYTQALGLVVDGVSWFGDTGGPADDAIFLAVTVVEPPPEPGPEASAEDDAAPEHPSTEEPEGDDPEPAVESEPDAGSGDTEPDLGGGDTADARPDAPPDTDASFSDDTGLRFDVAEDQVRGPPSGGGCGLGGEVAWVLIGLLGVARPGRSVRRGSAARGR